MTNHSASVVFDTVGWSYIFRQNIGSEMTYSVLSGR